MNNRDDPEPYLIIGWGCHFVLLLGALVLIVAVGDGLQWGATGASTMAHPVFVGGIGAMLISVAGIGYAYIDAHKP